MRVLQMQGAKDPDEYIKTFGPDAFRNLPAQSENHLAYRPRALQRNSDPQAAEQRAAYDRCSGVLCRTFRKQAFNLFFAADADARRDEETG